jgi:hypothetical protein
MPPRFSKAGLAGGSAAALATLLDEPRLLGLGVGAGAAAAQLLTPPNAIETIESFKRNESLDMGAGQRF